MNGPRPRPLLICAGIECSMLMYYHLTSDLPSLRSKLWALRPFRVPTTEFVLPNAQHLHPSPPQKITAKGLLTSELSNHHVGAKTGSALTKLLSDLLWIPRRRVHCARSLNSLAHYTQDPTCYKALFFCAAPERCDLPWRYVTYPGEEVQVAAQYYIAQTGLRKCGHPVCYYHYLHYRVQERLANPNSIDAR